MKSKFPGYYKPSESELSTIWGEAIFVLDANVLLNFYRLSDKSTNQLFTLLDHLNKQVWIPFQVAKEYHKNLNRVIPAQVEKYKETIKALQSFNDLIKQKNSHPFLDEETHDQITTFCTEIEQKLDKKQKEVMGLICNNPIKERIGIFFDSKVGKGFGERELETIYEEGDKRYNKSIPPGFKDKPKGKPEMYGDLILWKEILHEAKERKKPVIFVTSDTKEDWFLRVSGMTVGPLPDLIAEFILETEQQFYSYSLEQFLNTAKEQGIKIENEVIEEIKIQATVKEDTPNQSAMQTAVNSDNNIAEPNSSEVKVTNNSILNNSSTT